MAQKTTRFHRINVRHARIRRSISGTAERPRLAFKKSNKHLYAQVFDDTSGRSLAQITTTGKGFPLQGKSRSNKEAAKALGTAIAEAAKGHGVEKVVFDRGGFRYHGVVQEFADAARAAGLDF